MTSPQTGLILITASFPFDKGEEFIEPEIDYLAAVFDSVLVLPLSYSHSSVQTRTLPKNFTVVLPDEKFLRSSWRSTLLRFATQHPLRSMRIAATGLKHLPNTAQAAAEFRFSLSSALFYSAFTANLANALQPETRYTIYAYWFHTQASVGKHIHAEYGYPFISRGHRGDIYDHQSPINYLPGRTEILRSLDHLYAVSDQGRDYLRSRYPSYAERIDTARLGVSAARNAGNPSLKPHKVVSCSRVVPVKRLPLLIDAVAELQARGIELHWVHLGGGSPEATEELSRYAERHLTPDSYTLAGDLSNTELRDWYASNPATVFVNVSASEGVPVSIMEALAQGLPVIATDVGGTSELIKTETGMFGGLLTANPTASEVADRIEALFSLTDDAFTAAVQGSVSHWQGAWSSDTNFRAFAALLERSAR